MALFLTGGDARISLGYHYSIEFIPGLFWGFITGANIFADLLHRNIIATKPLKLLLPLLLFVMAFSTYGRSDIYFVRKYFPDAHRRWLQSEVMPCIDRENSLATAPKLVPHFALR